MFVLGQAPWQATQESRCQLVRWCPNNLQQGPYSINIWTPGWGLDPLSLQAELVRRVSKGTAPRCTHSISLLTMKAPPPRGLPSLT